MSKTDRTNTRYWCNVLHQYLLYRRKNQVVWLNIDDSFRTQNMRPLLGSMFKTVVTHCDRDKNLKGDVPHLRKLGEELFHRNHPYLEYICLALLNAYY